MPGQNDLWAWLQSVMPNQGAAQPNSVAGTPGYGAGPQGVMPGGGAMGYGATTPGQPSMGYPALQSQPPAPAGGNGHGDGPPDVMSPGAIYQQQPPPPAQASQANPPQGGPPQPAPVPNGQRGMPFPQDLGPASRNMPFVGSAADSGQYDSRGYFAPTPPGSPSATPRPADSAKGPLASSDAPASSPMKRRAGAANLGYYQPNNRFVGIDAPNASAQNSMRGGPQGTALNLAGLFGGGGQPAANPNVPAANAQPASASGPPGRQAPDMSGVTFDANGNPIPDYGDLQNWGYGPLQQGNIWRGSGGPRR